MDGLISKIRSTATGVEAPGTAPTHTLFFRPSAADSMLVTVHHSSYAQDALPLFTVKASEGVSMSKSAPDHSFSQNDQVMGETHFSMMTSKVHLSVRGRRIEMKQSSVSGNFSMDVSPLPKLKWKVNQMTGSSLQLVDEAGAKLAKIGKSSSLGGADAGQKLEIFVPCDEFFVDLCVISGYAVWILNKTTNEVVKQVVDAAAGLGS